MSGTPVHWTPARAAGHIAVPGPSSDKYRRGVLGVRTGSAAYPGAAVLGVEAAWRTGVGMVRYVPPLGDDASALGLPSPAAAVLAARPETVFGDGYTALGARCDAWLIGSGTDATRRGFAEREALRRILAGSDPVVVDAGALGELAVGEARTPIALTPHRGELLSLWRAAGLGGAPADWPDGAGHRSGSPEPGEGALLDAAQRLAEAYGATVLLKGSLSVVATPGGFRAIAGPATPWLAAAGTGDVLAGMLGAIAATHATQLRRDPELFGPLAASAAVLHDAAARRAAAFPREIGAAGSVAGAAWAEGEGPITALDVAHALPAAIAALSA